MQLRVLGPVEASADHRSLPLGGAKQRAVLAMLALEANRTVSADRLIEGLWGEDAARQRREDGAELRVAAARACWATTPARRSSRAGAATSCASTPTRRRRGASSGCSRGGSRRRSGRAGRRRA